MAVSESIRWNVLRVSRRLVDLRGIEVVVEAVVGVVLFRVFIACDLSRLTGSKSVPVGRRIEGRFEADSIVDSAGQAFGQMDWV